MKVSRGHGDRMVLEEAAFVAVRPTPRLVAGDLADRDLRLVARWIEANRDAILDYWEGAIDTLDLASRLVRIAPEGAG